MAGSTLIGAYWGPRGEEVRDAAGRLARTLAALAELDPALSRWYETGRDERDALARPAAAEPGRLEALLDAGRTRADFGGAPIDELGFGAALWTGADEGASLGVRAGATGGGSPNNVLLKLFPGAPVDPGRVAPAALRALVELWSPDRAMVIDDALFDAQEDAPGDVDAGWVTYVRGALEAGDLPAAARAERWPGGTAVRLGTPGEPLRDADVLAVRGVLAARQPG